MKGIQFPKGIKKIDNYIPFNEEENKNEPKHRYPFKKKNSISSIDSTKAIFQKNNNKNIVLKMTDIMKDYPEKYYKKYLKSEWLKFFVNLFVSLFHIIIILCFTSSFNACPKTLTLNECIKKIDIYYYYKVILKSFISGFLIAIIIAFILTKIVSIYQSPIIIIELIVFIFINHKNNIYQNGLFSFKILIIFIIISFSFLIFFILFLIKLGRKHYFYSVFFFAALFL